MVVIAGKLVLCRHCKGKDVTEQKSWVLKGGIRNNIFRIHLFRCNQCLKIFRVAEPINQ